MNKVPYSFSVLRYVHDPVTQEFVNIGIAVYSPDANYLRARCATQHRRITRMFGKINGNRLRQLTRYIEGQLAAIGTTLATQHPPGAGAGIDRMLAKVLPPDDSALQFSRAGVGLTQDLDQTLSELFERYVERYAGRREQEMAS